MKHLFTFALLALCLFTGNGILAQVGVGTITPDPSAQLDVTATDKGLLIPRMDMAGRDAIVTPATGLVIYQTNNTPGFYYFDGSTWKRVGDTSTVGFAATSTGGTQSASGPVTAGWTQVYSTGGFDVPTGTYTVPATGIYKISASVNYAHLSAISISIGAGVNPSMQIRKVVGSAEVLRGVFPILNVNVILVLTLRALINTGTVPIDGTVALNAGDQLQLFYDAGGYTVALNLGSGGGTGINWSVTKVN